MSASISRSRDPVDSQTATLHVKITLQTDDLRVSGVWSRGQCVSLLESQIGHFEAVVLHRAVPE